jgi:adenylate cyclase
MSDTRAPKERLAAILAADAVGFSRLMHDDERITLATLDEFRGVFRQRIEAHEGRVVDMAGDSILAVFDSATGAVNAATEAQLELAKRNEALPPERRMWFRVGVNLGDVLLKDDGTVYGDGVNVAARLQSMASPGGINVSGSVFNSVRAKIPGSFDFLGDQELKNIAGPVPVYSVGIAAGDAAKPQRPPPVKPSAAKTRPTVRVMPLQVISGGAEVEELAAGLHQDIVGGFTRQTAIEVRGELDRSEGQPRSEGAADFQLEGSIRAAGERLRLSFTLLDTAARRQIWSERYDRQLHDVFELEDEISRSVASAVRIKIKADAFEKLRDTKNDQLSVPELLSKAAGYFVNSHAHNEEVAEILRLALERMPESSMAHAMAVFCRYRIFEFSPFAIPADAREALFAQSDRALALDASSYFAHLIAAVIRQDIRGDYAASLVHAETALSLNPSFSQATAMVGIVKIHLGELELGLRMLQNGIDAAPEDPHRFRHLRELAIGHLLAGDVRRAAATLEKLIHQVPDLLRNELVLVPVLWHAGRQEEARRHVEQLLARHPDLTRRNMRPVNVRDSGLAARLADGLTLAGLPA